MKIIIAKLFCFLTILLMSGNIALSSNHIVTKEYKTNSFEKSTSKEVIAYKGISDGSCVNFIIENDPFEDFEFLADIPILYSFDFKEITYVQGSYSVYKPYTSTDLKIPLWLWTRSIII